MLFPKIFHLAAAGATLMASLPISLAADLRLGRPNRGLQTDVCLASPIAVVNNGTTEIFESEIYLIVSLQEPLNRTNFIDVNALDATADLAYNSAVDCSLSSGSIRSLTNCTTIIDNIIFKRDALLLKCQEYASNSIDGSNVLSSVNLYTNQTCSCTCGTAETPGTSFQDIVAPDGVTCPCSCTGSQADCVCYAPYVKTVLDNWNDLYQNQTDALGQNVSIFNVTSARILQNCNTPNFTYDATSVCLPESLIVQPDAPELIIPTTANPTKRPTKRPTKKPTKKPTRKPTKKPTRYPTRHPTKHPTPHPTKHPTPHPTKSPSSSPTDNPSAAPTPVPTGSPSESPTSNPSADPTSVAPTPPLPICNYLLANGFVRAFELLGLSGVCGVLQDVTKQFTFFVTSDSAYDSLRSSSDYSFTPSEWNDKWKEILEFSVIEGVALSPADLGCASQRGTLQGESIRTSCVNVVARSFLLTEMETRKFQYGDCNLGDLPQVMRWYQAGNGNIIQLSKPPLPNDFNDCVTSSPSEGPTISPSGLPSSNPTKTLAPTESAYPTIE